jgi:glycosyltransferase involved in cell wall biosynthesis
MIRVAYTTLAPFVSGAERSLQVTMRYARSAGIEPIVVGPPGAKLAEWCETNGFEFHATPFELRDKWHAWAWWKSQRKLARLLREQRIDVVHANQIWCYPVTGAAGAAVGIPRVCHLRDDANPKTLRWFCKTGVDAVVCISRHIRRQAEDAWPAGSHRPVITTLVNAVDLPAAESLRQPIHDERLVASAAAEIPDGGNAPVSIPEPVELPFLPACTQSQVTWNAASRRFFCVPPPITLFGFIGQIREVKGLLPLLNTLARLPSQLQWHLVVAGRDPRPGAPYEAHCRRRASQPDLAGKVTFVGFLDNSDAFYRAIDVAIVPSQEEPLGRIPLEAAAFAKPSIAFSVGGLPDTIVDGETGWLIPAQDWNAMSAAIQRCITTDTRSVGAAAREWVARVADPAAYAHRLASLYEQLLTGLAPTAVAAIVTS